MFTIEPRNHLVRSTKKKKKKAHFFFLCFRLFVSLDKILPLNKEKKEKDTFLFSMFSLIRIFAERSEHLNY